MKRMALSDCIDKFFSPLPVYIDAQHYFKANLIADVVAINNSEAEQRPGRIVSHLHQVVTVFRSYVDASFNPAIPGENDIFLKDIQLVAENSGTLTWLRNPRWLDAVSYVVKSRAHIPHVFSSDFHSYVNHPTPEDATEVSDNPILLLVRHFYRTTLIDSLCLTSDLNHALWVLAQSGDINAFTTELNEALAPLSPVKRLNFLTLLQNEINRLTTEVIADHINHHLFARNPFHERFTGEADVVRFEIDRSVYASADVFMNNFADPIKKYLPDLIKLSIAAADEIIPNGQNGGFQKADIARRDTLVHRGEDSFALEKSNEVSWLTDLLHALRKNHFVGTDTQPVTFKKAFTGKPIDSPIVWTGGIGSLHWFIKFLQCKGRIKAATKIWIITSQIFVHPDGRRFKNKSLKRQPRSRKIDLLETLIDNCID